MDSTTTFTFSRPVAWSYTLPSEAPKRSRRNQPKTRNPQQPKPNSQSTAAMFCCAEKGCPIETAHHAGKYHSGQLDAPFYIQVLDHKLRYQSVNWDEFMLLQRFYAAHAKNAVEEVSIEQMEQLIDERIDPHAKKAVEKVSMEQMEQLIDERIEWILEAKGKKPDLERNPQDLLALLMSAL